ncbi:MAG: ABC transporter ATP-binding protein [Rhodospirillales bacterium]|nr:ABC transporter ATP-binding protein [Rhodospirillales bacterium]
MSDNTNTPLVEANGLNTFYGASHILHGVDLTIGKGETVSLIGRNGMGKTTTIRSILGLTPPKSGTVKINGKDMTGAEPHNVSKMGIALVPEGRGIFPNLTVRENLQMSARPHNGKEDWTFERVLGIFPRISERLDNMGDQLSGGEQQMLSIGRALMTNPELLILDEATEGLAPLIRKEIWGVVKMIKETGIATLIVDKDIKSLLSISDKCVIVSKGKVVYANTAEHLDANPDIHIQHMGV